MKSNLGPKKTGFERNTKKFDTQNIFLVSCVNNLSLSRTDIYEINEY